MATEKIQRIGYYLGLGINRVN